MLFFFSFLIAFGFLSSLLAELSFDRPFTPPPPPLKEPIQLFIKYSFLRNNTDQAQSFTNAQSTVTTNSETRQNPIHIRNKKLLGKKLSSKYSYSLIQSQVAKA